MRKVDASLIDPNAPKRTPGLQNCSGRISPTHGFTGETAFTDFQKTSEVMSTALVVPTTIRPVLGVFGCPLSREYSFQLNVHVVK